MPLSFARVAKRAARLAALRLEDPAQFYFTALFWSFWVHLALFPIGYAWRDIMPPVCFIFLLLYYRHDWKRCVLARLEVLPLFYCFWVMLLIGVLFSNHPLDSLLHSGANINKGFMLPFIAMECVKEEKDLRRLVWACVLACFWQGLDGIWQAYSGVDFIRGYPLFAGRLTGTFDDYAVGNYIALAMIPAFAFWFILRERFCRARSAILIVIAFSPPFFLLLGALARSGMLAVAAALGLWWWFFRTQTSILRRCLLPLSVSAGLVVLFFALAPRRKMLSFATIQGDSRWNLWELGWRVFRENSWLGAGAGQYNVAFRSLGLTPASEPITISHPHNIYLDILYAHGIVGFILGMTFLLGFLVWGYRRIRPGLIAECKGEIKGLYWRLTVAFWIGYAAWFVNGIFGHSFYCNWWFALAMSYLGIMIGAVVNGHENETALRAAQ